MPINDMGFAQIATVLNSIHNQATGSTALTPTDTREFVAQAQTALKTGYDPICGAISQVLSRTIFSIRPYTAKFRGLMVSAQRYGNHVRKINWGDKPYTEDDRIKITDGVDAPQQIPNVPKVLQTNFYGQSVFQDSYTLYRDQLDVAFTGPDEFQRFIAGTIQNVMDKLEQARENLARALLANYIGAKYVTTSNLMEGSEGYVHLLTEYNAATGLSLDAQTVMQPANFPAFMKWVYARIDAISKMLTERSYLYHMNLSPSGVDKAIPRHTPRNMQRVYLYGPALSELEARVLADTYHDTFIRYADVESVNFWQSIKTPQTVSVHPNFINVDGTVGETAQDVEVGKVFGLILDEETLGWTPVNQWSAPAPFNARHGFTTVWLHETQRHWTDMTENGVVLLLD